MKYLVIIGINSRVSLRRIPQNFLRSIHAKLLAIHYHNVRAMRSPFTQVGAHSVANCCYNLSVSNFNIFQLQFLCSQQKGSFMMLCINDVMLKVKSALFLCSCCSRASYRRKTTAETIININGLDSAVYASSHVIRVGCLKHAAFL